jgi:YrbI family 3-deoxy-D-manno-octulosonate 8-phosphate phosphatase
MALAEKCRRVRLILSDVDGVLTDGGVILGDDGQQIVKFHIRDGLGIRVWRESGGRFGLVTGRNLAAVRMRAETLSVDVVRQGAGDKLPVVDEILTATGFDRGQACFIGDDLPDLPAVRAVGLGIAVADAAEEVRAAADYVTSVPGGHGAVREAVELILKNADRWEEAIREFTGP